MEKPRQLPSGKWQGRVTGPDGHRYGAGTHTSERKAAAAQARKLAELEAAAEKAQEEQAGPKTKFVAYAEEYLYSRRPGEVGGWAPTSYYKNLMWAKNKLVPTFGSMYVEDITPRDIRAWWTKMAAAPSVRQSAYYLMNSVFEMALDDELITRNPCRIKGSGKAVGKKRPTFSMADVAKLVDGTEDAQFKALLLLLAGSSVRIGEAMGLNWTDLAFLDGTLTVQRHFTRGMLMDGTKTGAEKTRELALPTWSQRPLEALYATADGDGPMFLNTKGRRLSVDSAERAFRILRVKVGLPTIRIHDVRHVSLSAYARQPGVTLADVMVRGGHTTVRVAQNYQHADQEQDKAAALALPDPMKAHR